MRRRVVGQGLSWLLMLLLSLVPARPDAQDNVAGLWTFDEPAGERTAVDRGPHGLDGEVGADVGTGVEHEGVTGYRFADVAPNSPPIRPGHLVTLPSDPSLDPGNGGFAVTVRVRTANELGNLVQKGQRETAGGYWKIEIDRGGVRCVFFDDDGHGVQLLSNWRIDDGEWHAVTCRRTTDAVAIYLDGVRDSLEYGATGRIANDWPVTIGAKPRCNQESVGCDYFSGDMDYLRVEKW